jgi:hypothetical protein
VNSGVRKLLRGVPAALVLAAAGSSPAFAGDNDISLQEFGSCVPGEVVGGQQSNCVSVDTDEAGFRSLARDIGLTFSPRMLATGETTGVSGFSFGVAHSVNTVDSAADYWVTGSATGEPNGALATTQLTFRKGLPFSLELGTSLTALWDSRMIGVNTEVRWALHEDWLWPAPDLAFRGFVGTVLGNSQLQLLTAGFDAVTGVPIGISNVMNITPYAGLNMTAVISSSRLIDATPSDPTPPFDASDPRLSNKPEFLFDTETNIVLQGLGGLRFQFAMLDVYLQGTFASAVQSYTLGIGFNF